MPSRSRTPQPQALLSAEAQADAFRDVARVLNAVRPMIQADGGDVELVDLTPEGVVRIRWRGACVGCPSSEMTLREGIERNLRVHVPAVAGVEAVD
ncbi:MAG: NifU family protein [Phycisphaerales bacterium]|nr:NifU family protein [Phycisphaerales bacterium]